MEVVRGLREGKFRIGRDADLGDVQAIQLIFVPAPVWADRVDELQYEVGEDPDGDQIGQSPDALGEKLRGVAVKQSLDGARDSVPTVAVAPVGKQTEGKYSPRPIEAVDRDGPDRIVDF